MPNRSRSTLRNLFGLGTSGVLSLESTDLSVYAGKLLADRRRHRRAPALSEGDFSDSGPPVFSQTELARYTTVEARVELMSIELRRNHISLIEPPKWGYSHKHYRYAGKRQGESVEADVTEVQLSARLKMVRERILKLSQTQLSNRLGISQSNVSRWETGQAIPEPAQMMKLAQLLEGRVESLYFIEAAGVPVGYLNGDKRYAGSSLPNDFWAPTAEEHRRDSTQIPLLRDAAAAGTARAISDEDIETFLTVPRNWVPRSSALVAVRIQGDSMQPLICDGSIVLIDTAQREPKRLVNRIVAARDGEGVTIKLLRQDGDAYMLVAFNQQSSFPATIFDENNGYAIVGVVLNSIAFHR